MKRPQLSEMLSALDLSQVTITATIDPAGRLGAVGGLWSKLLAAAQEAATVGLLRVMVVAERQPDVPLELLKPEAAPLRVIPAATLEQAVAKLYELHGPRFVIRHHEHQQCARLDILGKSVPMEAHYQVLPLLREVKRERLPRDPQGSDREEDKESRLRPVDILRWEETLRAEQVTYELVSLTQVFENFQTVAKEAKTVVPRLVVLGPPGSGKTTLVQYLAWQAARGELRLAGQQLVPARLRLREWEAWAVKPTDPDLSLPEYLVEQFKDLYPQPTPEQWRAWLRRGDVLLLLDGLDEISSLPTFLTALKTTLTIFPNCPIVLTCRTVSFEQHRALCPDFPIFTLAGLDEPQRDSYIRGFPADHPDRFDPQALLEQLKRTPQMQPLAANPLLLSIICYVVDDPQGVRLPASRGELYDKAVEKLLLRPRRLVVTYPGGRADLPLIRQRRILERVALKLFAGLGQQRQLTVDEATLVDILTEEVQSEGLANPADVADTLLRDLVYNSGLLRGSPSQGYFFLHLTVQEFLAAGALARAVNKPGGGDWETLLRLGSRDWTVKELVDKKAWDRRWQEVIKLLAGQLQDPEPLLRLLADEQQDDIFRHRLALAAWFLPEIHTSRLRLHTSRVDQITTVAFSCWWAHQLADTVSAVHHLTRTLPSLAQVNGRVEGTPILVELYRRLHNPDRYVREKAAAALEQMGAAAAQPAVLSALSTALHNSKPLVRGSMRLFFAWPDPESSVRLRVVEALGQMGAAAAQPEVLSALSTALHDPDRHVRKKAAEVLEKMGAAAAQPEVLSALSTALHNPDQDIRWSAAAALGQMGAAAAQPEVLSALSTVLHDLESSVRERAAKRLRQMGAAAAKPKGLWALPVVPLPDPESSVRLRVVEALGQMGAAAAQPEVLSALSTALHDPERDVRWRAAEVLEKMGAAAVQSEVLSALLAALYNPDRNIRWRAEETLRKMGAAAQPEILSALVVVLHDPDRDIRWSAAAALGQMGTAAAQPEVLSALVVVLHDPDRDIRWSAAAALGQMGAAAAQPKVLSALLAALYDPESSVRWRAADALGQMGAAAQPEVLSALVVALCDPKSFVRWRAAEVLEQMGAAAAQPEVLSALVTNLHDPEWDVRESAAKALGQMGAAAVQTEVLSALVVALCDPKSFVRRRAAEVLEEMGTAAAQPEVLSALIINLHDPEWDVRENAVKALGQMGVAAAQPEVLLALSTALHDPEWDVRESAAKALGQMGAAAVQSEVLSALVTNLRDPEASVRRRAAEVLEEMGTAAAQPEVLSALSATLRDPDRDIHGRAAEVLGMIAQEVRIFRRQGGTVEVRGVAELANL